MMVERDVLDAKVRSADPKQLSNVIKPFSDRECPKREQGFTNVNKHKKQTVPGTKTARFCVYKVQRKLPLELDKTLKVHTYAH